MNINKSEIPEHERQMQEVFKRQDREMGSAETIVKNIIYPFFSNIKSVADFGGRGGHFIKAIFDKYNENGKEGLSGVSIDMLPYSEKMYIPKDNYLQEDITKVKLENPVDLVMCIETAEHIDKSLAEDLVKNLCDNSNGYVLFSAAFPGQGGYCHVNEQPPEYWENIFKIFGYEKHDCIRYRLWQHEKDDLKYRYLPNMYLYVEKGKKLPEGLTDIPLPFVVPQELYEQKLRELQEAQVELTKLKKESEIKETLQKND